MEMELDIDIGSHSSGAGVVVFERERCKRITCFFPPCGSWILNSSSSLHSGLGSVAFFGGPE